MVVLAPRNWYFASLYPWLQDGRIVHIHEYRCRCLVRSMGDSGYQERAYNGESFPALSADRGTEDRPTLTVISRTE
jgi:hypothetical protein